jgi:hypothetical protein
MSRRSAPCRTNSSPRAAAASVEAWLPPSEKLSGVTLRMPMTSGRSNVTTRPASCQRNDGAVMDYILLSLGLRFALAASERET